MLTDYDAKAVAEVMGLAFLQSPEQPALPPKVSKAGLQAAGADDFILHIDHARVRIVELKAKSAVASPRRVYPAALRAVFAPADRSTFMPQPLPGASPGIR